MNEIEKIKQLIIECNQKYYFPNGDEESPLSDYEYDNLCKQYVELNRTNGVEIELASCRFLGIKK